MRRLCHPKGLQLISCSPLSFRLAPKLASSTLSIHLTRLLAMATSLFPGPSSQWDMFSDPLFEGGFDPSVQQQQQQGIRRRAVMPVDVVETPVRGSTMMTMHLHLHATLHLDAMGRMHS